MKTIKTLICFLLLGSTITLETGCLKKGADDPFISFRSRKNRISNDWILVQYQKNDGNIDLSGTYTEWNMHDNGAIDQTQQGTIFGFTARETHTGTWTFVDDAKSVSISNNNDTKVYVIDRLEHTQLWLIRTDGSDTYTYHFQPR